MQIIYSKFRSVGLSCLTELRTAVCLQTAPEMVGLSQNRSDILRSFGHKHHSGSGCCQDSTRVSFHGRFLSQVQKHLCCLQGSGQAWLGPRTNDLIFTQIIGQLCFLQSKFTELSEVWRMRYWLMALANKDATAYNSRLVLSFSFPIWTWCCQEQANILCQLNSINILLEDVS